MQQFSDKLKKVRFQAYLGTFCPKTGKWDVFRKIRLSVYSPYGPHHHANQKKTNQPILRKVGN